MRWTAGALFASALALACAAAQNPEPSFGDANPGEIVLPVEEPDGDAPASRTLAARGTTRIEAEPPPPEPQPPPAARRRVDVQLHRAQLGEALRLIADAARLNLVVHGDASAEVSVSLRRVRAWDAIVALAEAHGARVELRDNIVIVRR